MNYEPRDTHDNFVIPVAEFPYDGDQKRYYQDTHTYRYINKHDEYIGKYTAKTPYFASIKILRQIFINTKEKNPIYEMLNEDTNMLYKYAGQVQEIAPKKIFFETNGKIKKIKQTHIYKIRQISAVRYNPVKINSDPEQQNIKNNP